MKIILKEDVRGVGRKHEIKNVADGFARNFLIPRGEAEIATPQTIKNAESALLAVKAEKEKREAALTEDIKKLNGGTIAIPAKANEKGSLFAGIGKEHVVEILKEQGYGEIFPENLLLPEPIKTLGMYAVGLVTHGKKIGEFVLTVKKE